MKTPDSILAEDLARILDAPLPWEQLYGRHVLVTGASGFIGGHVVEALAWLNRCHPQANLRIHAMARDLEKLRQRLPWLDLPGEVTPLIQDVTQPCALDTPPDVIIHAASPASPRYYLDRPVETILANSNGTQHLLELVRGRSAQFLFLSSGAVYGENTLRIDAIGETDFGGEDPLAPRACYSESKRLAETLCQAYHAQYGVDTRIARISHCYGPGMRLDDGRAIADLLADVLAGRDIRLDSDGSTSRPFCYISDIVLGLFHILLRGEPGNAYNLGETQETTILELAEKMIAVAGKHDRLRVRAQARSGLALAARSSGHFDIDKIIRLGWKPSVDLETGLARMLGSHGVHVKTRNVDYPAEKPEQVVPLPLSRPCEICGGEQELVHRQVFLFPGFVQSVHYDVVTCDVCGFCYASDIPDQSALNQFYQAAEHHLHAELPPGLARIHADFFEFVHGHASLADDARILDIGSGMGHFLHHFQRAGFHHVQGMEPSPAAAELARKTYGLDIHSASVDTFVASERFDLVSLCGVLEHIADLHRSMERISALLRDDGYLFIAVPDAATFGQAVPTEPFLEFALEHINFFSATSLDNLLRACGFEKVTVISQHNDFYDNSYLLALYRRACAPSSAIVCDKEAAPSLRAYVDLSRQSLQPVEAMARQLVASQEPLLIWGAGALTSRLLCDTSLGQANICGVIDRNRGLQGKTLLNTLITAPDSVGDHPGATIFIASTTYAAEIRETLLQQHCWTGRIITLASGAVS